MYAHYSTFYFVTELDIKDISSAEYYQSQQLTLENPVEFLTGDILKF